MNLAQSARTVAQVVPFVRRSPDMGEPAPTTPAADPDPAPRSERGGLPVLFLHGWGVGPHSYAAPVEQLQAFGCRVYSPALPGFGGTPALVHDECNFPGYGRWVASYLDAMAVDEPVTVVGHSFGGGVAMQFAYDHPERTAAAVLCNAVGGFPWAGPPGTGTMAERPWWEWGRFLGADLLALPALMRVLPALLGEAVPNLVSNPLAMWRVGEFVRRAHLLEEVAALSARRMPLTFVWSDRDRLVPHAGFSALCRVAGVEGQVVPGNHSWLIAEPRRFADIVLRAMVEAGVVEASLAATG